MLPNRLCLPVAAVLVLLGHPGLAQAPKTGSALPPRPAGAPELPAPAKALVASALPKPPTATEPALPPAPATPAAAVTPTKARVATPPPVAPSQQEKDERAALDLEARQATEAQEQAAAAARVAAEAHKRALAEARQARDAAQKALATEKARVEKARLEIATFRSDLAERRKAASKLAQQRFERRTKLASRAKADRVQPSKADALYLDLVKIVEAARDGFEVDLRALRDRAADVAPSAAAEASAAFRALPAEQRQSIELRLSAVRAERRNLIDTDRQRRLATCAASAEHLQALNDLRTGLIDALSPAARDELFGLTGAGIAQLRRELRHVQLLAQWYPTSRLSLTSLPRSVDDVILKLSSLTMSLLKGLLFVLLWWLARRRWRGWVEEARQLLQGRRGLVWRGLDVTLALTLVFGRELGWLLVIVAVFSWVLDAGLATELDLLYDLALIWATYRLVLAATHRFFTSAARLRLRTRHVEVSAELSGRILASVQLVARYAFAVWAVLSIASHTVGRGYLHLLVVRFSWVGAVPIAILLVRSWQADISEAYLRAYPDGGLAELVERTRDKPVGLFVAFAAFAYVALRGVALWAGDVAMSFDETRRVLAYLFRRELERRADKLAITSSVEDLPGPVQDAFLDRPAAEDAIVGELVGLQDTVDSIEAWLAGGRSLAIMLTGSWGSGKTTWMGALARRVLALESDASLVTLHVSDRPRDASEVLRFFTRHLGHPECQTVDSLARTLRVGPRRVVLLDDAGQLALRAMGGMKPWTALSDLIGATRGHVFWVVAGSRHTAYLASKLLPNRDTYDRVITLQPWTEDQIGSLIGQRMEACGAEASFDDLWETLDEGQDSFVEGLRAGERFIRLIWDHTDGNPRDALYFWLRSLVPDGGEVVRVHLFAARKADELEHLRTLSRFTLQAVLVHGGLSADEVSRVLYEDRGQVETTLAWLAEQGIVQQRDDQRWRVSPAWYRAAVRYLRRKHLLPGD